MNKLAKYAEYFMMAEFMKAKQEVFQNESGREGVDFIIKTKSGNYHELYLQPINLETERSVKIAKTVLGEPKDNLWVALVLFMKDIEPVLYLITHYFSLFFIGIRECFAFPSTQLAKPDDYIFIDNDQGERFKHLSNWETQIHEYN